MATLKDKSIDLGVEWSDRDFMSKQDAALAVVCAKIRAKRPDDKLAGELLHFGVADGSAVYVIESSKPLRLSHVDYCDNYMVPYTMIRGLRLADVEARIGAERGMRRLFASKGVKS